MVIDKLTCDLEARVNCTHASDAPLAEMRRLPMCWKHITC